MYEDNIPDIYFHTDIHWAQRDLNFTNKWVQSLSKLKNVTDVMG